MEYSSTIKEGAVIMVKIGQYNHLSVLRETPIAFLLTDGSEEIFLHKKEAERSYLPSETIDVFVYVDNLGRKTASTKRPFITIDQAAFLEVKSSNFDYGVFLGNNLIKDLLLSKDDLPLKLDLWPQPGDFLFVTMKEKKDHLFAKLLGRKEIFRYFDDPLPMVEMDETEAYVMYLVDEGIVAFTLLGQEIFIHKNNLRKGYRLGELIRPKIVRVASNHEYTGTLIEQKETMIESDGQIILDYLTNHQGKMRFTDKSSAEMIQSVFKMSKSAFKRALGSLYKQGLVELDSAETRQIKK